MLRLNSHFNPYFHPPPSILVISRHDELWEIFLNVLRATAT